MMIGKSGTSCKTDHREINAVVRTCERGGKMAHAWNNNVGTDIMNEMKMKRENR